MKTLFFADTMTAEQVLADEQREYNPSAWKETVARYTKYKDVSFYYVKKGVNNCDYSRIFVAYTLPEGLRIFAQLSYHSCLSGGGFTTILILPTAVDGRVEICSKGFGPNQDQRADNSKGNRKLFVEHGLTVSNSF